MFVGPIWALRKASSQYQPHNATFPVFCTKLQIVKYFLINYRFYDLQKSTLVDKTLFIPWFANQKKKTIVLNYLRILV